MTSSRGSNELPLRESHERPKPFKELAEPTNSRWRIFLHNFKSHRQLSKSESSLNRPSEKKMKPAKWSLGVLNDRETEQVPGSILLMSNSKRNAPLGLRNAEARTSASSMPSPYFLSVRPEIIRQGSTLSVLEKKRTPDGEMILEPQPDDSMNDPLNWPSWRRDVALLSLGFYCMLGGGMTPILAAGFKDVAQTYNVSIPKVALTTGLYMMGLGLGSVIASPTAILYGKRPVYLVAIILYIISSIWCALSPNYASLVVARIFMGLAVSPVECLPSATIAEIFFLHERAYRLGVYTLLLLSGKNLVPLASAAIIEGLGWRWVFWIVAMIVAFCFVLVFFFVPETFWDRTPRRSSKGRRRSFTSMSNIRQQLTPGKERATWLNQDDQLKVDPPVSDKVSGAADAGRPAAVSRKSTHRVEFISEGDIKEKATPADEEAVVEADLRKDSESQPNMTSMPSNTVAGAADVKEKRHLQSPDGTISAKDPTSVQTLDSSAPTDTYLNGNPVGKAQDITANTPSRPPLLRASSTMSGFNAAGVPLTGPKYYTRNLRRQPAKTFKQTLKPWVGRLQDDKWILVALRPFILFAYPAILWSTLVYSLSIGWLIVLSESVAYVYQNKKTYNFSPLGTGLVYVSPFVGGILGTAVAGRVSDIIVRFMSRRNGGIYEPEFRLVMGFPVAVSTCIGLMGFGWSAAERDKWIVPTVFFGIISFGCALGSTTAITFAVDSYRQYAGEALVTLNFSKNIFHGLVFSLFFNHWLEADGSKKVFIAIGGIQLACLTTTIPIYIFGKRARMWTVRKKMMEKF